MMPREKKKRTELNSNKRDIYIVFFFHEYILPNIPTVDL